MLKGAGFFALCVTIFLHPAKAADALVEPQDDHAFAVEHFAAGAAGRALASYENNYAGTTTITSKDAGDKTKECKECTMEAAKHVMKYVWDEVQEKCKDKSPSTLMDDEVQHEDDDKKTHWCAFVKAHPKMAEGLLIEKVNPLALGYMYCLGKQVCDKKDDKPAGHQGLDAEDEDHAGGLSYFDPNAQELQFLGAGEQIVAQMMASSATADEGEESDVNPEDGKGKGKGGKGEGPNKGKGKKGKGKHHHGKGKKGKGKGGDDDCDEDDDDDENKNDSDKKTDDAMADAMLAMSPAAASSSSHVAGLCKCCFRKLTRKVMKFAVRVTKKMCAKADKGKTLAAFCKWGEENPEMAFGWLLGKVEPQKYALLPCMKWGKTNMWHMHHHKHDHIGHDQHHELMYHSHVELHEERQAGHSKHSSWPGMKNLLVSLLSGGRAPAATVHEEAATSTEGAPPSAAPAAVGGEKNTAAEHDHPHAEVYV
ncbi:unnamed protein product [Amoebophrya sp. A120]|nr:unnamed protein product [Amoebophrya sp. A120]|eukprot:GSA120T00015634001.1